MRDDLVWLDRLVLDLAARAPLAQIEGGALLQPVAGQVVGLARTGEARGAPTALCAWTMPPAGAAPVKGAGATVNVGQGARVTIDIQLDGDGASEQKARDALTKTLTERGAQVVPDGDVRIVSRVENGKTENQTIESITGGRTREDVTITPKTTRFFIEAGGKVLWELSSTSGFGGMVQRKQGQSFQDAINQSIKADTGMVINSAIPEVILTAEAASLPQYKLVPGGVQKK